MSSYKLRTQLARDQRNNAVADVAAVSEFLWSRHKNGLVPYGNSIRALERSVAIAWERICKRMSAPTVAFTRPANYYELVLQKVTASDRRKFDAKNWLNDVLNAGGDLPDLRRLS